FLIRTIDNKTISLILYPNYRTESETRQLMSRDKARLNDNWDDEQRQDQYHVPTMPIERPRRAPLSSPPRQPSSQPRQRPRKRRSVWPWLLMGCALGIIILVAAAAITVFLTIRSATGGSIIPGAPNPATYT